MAKTPSAPSGLSISRNNNTFSFCWKLGGKYTAQNLYYQLNKTGKTTVSIAKGTTAKAVTVNLNNYYPKTSKKLTNVKFFVQGKKSKWSAWANKEYAISVPPKPVLSADWSSEYENRCSFYWEIDWGNLSKETSPAVFKNYQWWTVLLPNSELTPEQITDWGSDSGVTIDNADSSYKTIDETTVFADDYSYTRYFKIVARGPAGDSKPSYAKHVYAFPNAARNVEASAVKISGGYRVSVSWTADTSNSRPIDSVSVEYSIDTPVSTVSTVDGVRKTTLSAPSNLSWTTATTTKDTANADGVAFVINGGIDFDKCIFVRVVTKHDNKISPSDTVFVNGGYGLLSAPSALSAMVDSDNIATISVSNNSDVSASFVGIYHRTTADPTPRLVGVWPASQSSAISVQLPDPGTEIYSIGARTFIADYAPAIASQSGVTEYAITEEKMSSSGIVWDERAVPKPPTNITLSSPKTGVIRVTWDWTWTTANGVELSWADHDDAWESTDEPQTYTLENIRASAWNIAGLDVGTWYIRVRLFKVDGDAITYGTYSDIQSIKISASPDTPALTISPSIVSPDSTVTCYWAFSASDGDEQGQAEIREVTLDSNGAPIAYTDIGVKADNEQYKTINVADLGWEAGSTHYLAVKVMSVSGEQSDNWSLPKPVQILEPITASIISSSLVTTSVVIDDTTTPVTTESKISLTAMPLSVTATGAGYSGIFTYILERAADYHLNRPDESEVSGFAGETIALIQKSAEAESDVYSISIGIDDLIGHLDDGAVYNLIAIAQDSYGQTASDTITFEVHWDHQAIIPSAIIEVDNDNMIAMITPVQPNSGYLSGDVCDIYRLSTDKPELIVQDAVFGTKYVDPYPSLGNMGGHRVVYRTANGDYITADNEFAWIDYDSDNGDIVDRFATVIDFGDDQIVLPYDLSLSTKWSKDFTTTKYLGGAMTGDWNPAVERTGTVKTRVAVQHDPELISLMRALANYAGICHVRTPDGSSFVANVNVSEDREEKNINMVATFSLEITRVDSEGFDGLTYSEWINDEI